MMGKLGSIGQKFTGWLGIQRVRKPSCLSPHEKRQWPRFDSGTLIRCVPTTAQGQEFTARVVDISEGGIRLDGACACEPGSLLHVSVPESTCRLLACVLHAMPGDEENHWLLGCVFIRELSNDEMQAFL